MWQVESELETYLVPFNQSFKQTFYDDGNRPRNVYFNTPSFAVDANSTFRVRNLICSCRHFNLEKPIWVSNTSVHILFALLHKFTLWLIELHGWPVRGHYWIMQLCTHLCYYHVVYFQLSGLSVFTDAALYQIPG